MLGGVAAGIAEYFNVDPTLIRLLFVLLAFATAGFPVVLLYFILWVIMPRNPNPAA
jgi:phage shock protein PspC (stress-responsive transcriptional regulator)